MYFIKLWCYVDICSFGCAWLAETQGGHRLRSMISTWAEAALVLLKAYALLIYPLTLISRFFQLLQLSIVEGVLFFLIVWWRLNCNCAIVGHLLWIGNLVLVFIQAILEWKALSSCLLSHGLIVLRSADFSIREGCSLHRCFVTIIFIFCFCACTLIWLWLYKLKLVI